MTQLQVDELLTYIDRSHQRTSRVVKCVPPESLEHSFGEGRFTLGDIVRHLAGINRYMSPRPQLCFCRAIPDMEENWRPD